MAIRIGILIFKRVPSNSQAGKAGITSQTTLDEYYKFLMNDFNGKMPEFAKESRNLSIAMFSLSCVAILLIFIKIIT
jgi:hypothetical protein